MTAYLTWIKYLFNFLLDAKLQLWETTIVELLILYLFFPRPFELPRHLVLEWIGRSSQSQEVWDSYLTPGEESLGVSPVDPASNRCCQTWSASNLVRVCVCVCVCVWRPLLLETTNVSHHTTNAARWQHKKNTYFLILLDVYHNVVMRHHVSRDRRVGVWQGAAVQ